MGFWGRPARPRAVGLFLLTLLLSLHARAELVPPFDLEHADVLPSGVYSPRVKTLVSSFGHCFSDSGEAMPIGQRMHQAVRFGDLIQGEAIEARRAAIRSLMAEIPGVTDASAVGSVTGDVSVATSTMVPVLMAGVTPKLTIGVAVPILKVSVNADSGFTSTPEGQRFLDAACAGSSPVACESIANRLNGALSSELARLGYAPIQSETITAIGDVRFLARYSLVDDLKDSFLVKSTLYFPTGVAPSADKLVGAQTGTGRYGLGMAAVYERVDPLGISERVTWTVHGGYHAYAPDSVEMRIPTSRSRLSADKEKVSRGFTHLVSAGTALKYGLPAIGTQVGFGYQVQHATATSLRGTRFEGARYDLLEQGYPAETLHAATVQVSFSTTRWYRNNQFGVPFEVSASYSHALGGRNTPRAHLWAGEAIFYF